MPRCQVHPRQVSDTEPWENVRERARDGQMRQVALIVTNPATEEAIAELEPAGIEETDATVARAKAASKNVHLATG